MKTAYKIGLVLSPVAIGVGYLSYSTPEEKETKYLRRGNTLFQQGEYEKARLEYKNAARIMPTDAEVDYRMGWSMRRRTMFTTPSPTSSMRRGRTRTCIRRC